MNKLDPYNFDGEGDVFDDRGRAVGRARLTARRPRPPDTTGERRGAEQRLVGKIVFDGAAPTGPPLDLIGKRLTMRLDDGRTLDLMLFDSGNIHVIRVFR